MTSSRTIDSITERLATGLDVSSALDNPQNFFSAAALRNVALDNSRLLDGIGQNIRTIEETFVGLEALEKLVDQAESAALLSQENLRAGNVDTAIFTQTLDTSPPSLSSQILADSPDFYYRLNEGGGSVVNDSGFDAGGPNAASLNSGATLTGAPLYTNDPQGSALFDGVNDRIRVSDNININTQTEANRTVELVFNADDTTPRQVLYEEGATVNGLTIYVDNGRVYVTAEDDSGGNRYADVNISAPINAGETYHVAFVFNGPAQSFTGYLNGVEIGTFNTGEGSFPSHSGDIGIGGTNGGVQFHDGEDGTANGYNFGGRISDVAIYNRPLTEAELFSHADSLNASETTIFLNEEYEKIINQIDLLVEDASYRGVNLLEGEDLTTYFNPDRSNSLVTEGVDFTRLGLGLERFNFNDPEDLQEIIDSVRAARDDIRSYASSLTSDLSILKTRQTTIQDRINTHISGADDLTVADMNEEGANMLAAQTRQTLGVTALSLASESASAVLRLF